MHRIRPLLIAGALVLAVGIGTTVALTTRQAPTTTATPPAAQPTSPTTAPGDPSTSPPPTTPRTPQGADEAKAVATARPSWPASWA